MKYIKFSGGNGYCGCDFTQYEAFKDKDFSESNMEEWCSELAYDNAVSYNRFVEDGLDEDDYETEEEWIDARDQAYEDYYADAYCEWKEVTLQEYLENK